MQELAKKIPELVNILITKNREADDLKSKLATDGLAVDERSKNLDKKSSELDARESKVKGIEDVKSLADNVEIGIKKLKADNAQLNIEKTAFETYQADTKKENLTLQKSLESSIDAADKKEKKYEEGLENLKVKEKELREKIAKELLK